MKLFVRKLTAILVLLLLLAGCNGNIPTETTDAVEPSVQSTEAPTTVPTDPPVTPTTAPTEPTTAPTEPPITVITPSMWMIEPEYPSYEALFSQDVPYSNFSYDWIVEQDGIYREYRVESSEEGMLVSSYGLTADYLVPNTKDFRG